MGSHGRRSGKLIFDSFRSCSWRIMPKTQIMLSNTRFSQFEHLLTPAWNRAKFHIGISSQSLISQRLGLRSANRNLCNPFLNEARRFYYVDRHNDMWQHRKSRGLRQWFRNGVLILTGCAGVVVMTYYGHLEMVPYHKRTRLILFSESRLRSITEMQFKKWRASREGRILPDTHLESIRVRKIAQDIIDAYEHEIQQQGSLLRTSELDGLNWEVLVMSGSGNSFAISCGKIVLYDWMFEHVTSDDEIAFLVGREIGHVVARHYAEDLTTAWCFKILKPLLMSIGLWRGLVDKYFTSIIRVFWKHEFEADYIGLRLSASAGYDPGEAPKLLEKIDKYSVPSLVYPTPKMRAQYLSFPDVMKELRHIYLRKCIKGMA